MITIDFETYSGTDITLASSYKYMHDPDADLLCLGYKFNADQTMLWQPGSCKMERLFDAVMAGEKIYAHNALFEYLAWNILGPKYGFPELPLEQLVDTAALANRYTLPGALDKCGKILGLDVQKDPRGKKLIKLICCPNADGVRPVVGKDFTQTDLFDLGDYCVRDVDSTYELIQALPADELTEEEQYYWELTQRMNLAGLPVDAYSAERILDYVTSYATEMTRRVPEVCDGAFQKVTQVKKMREWMDSLGVPTSNLQANTVDKLMKNKNLPGQVREMLELRQAVGRSSTAKYKKIKEMQLHGRVYNNLLYSGTSTGRWAGRGFQMHNLPRASVNDPEAVIDRFVNFEPVDDPVNMAKALIRPMICAPEGRMLLVSDYSSIENRLLAWVAGEEESLQAFRDGADQYVEMASSIYGIVSANVTKPQRQIGKIVVLGCGFQMGGKRFKGTAADWGVEVSLNEAYHAVDSYRKKNPKIKKLWGALSKCCVAAIQNLGKTYVYNGCSFRVVHDRASNVWLVLGLPSGRNLFYMDPYLSEDQYGLVPGHYGVDPYTRKWERRKLIPGRITENVIQALARDIMANGLKNVEQAMHTVQLIGTVHDEALAEGPDDMSSRSLNTFNFNLCLLPAWAKGLPLAAEGYIAKRYRK